MQKYVRRISLVYNTLVHCECVNFKVTGINFMTVFIARRDAACLQLGLQPYCRVISLGTVHSMPLSACISQSLRRLEAVKLVQTGFGDFLADSRVSRLKGSVTAIKRCNLLIQFLRVPDTNKLIVNITE